MLLEGILPPPRHLHTRGKDDDVAVVACALVVVTLGQLVCDVAGFFA
jgi:hypothetical protein